MFKIIALTSFAAALALAPAAAFAQSGDYSTSYGSEGWQPRVPTISLTNRDRAWNHDNQARYQAEASAEWIRTHGQGPLPLGQ